MKRKATVFTHSGKFLYCFFPFPFCFFLLFFFIVTAFWSFAYSSLICIIPCHERLFTSSKRKIGKTVFLQQSLLRKTYDCLWKIIQDLESNKLALWELHGTTSGRWLTLAVATAFVAAAFVALTHAALSRSALSCPWKTQRRPQLIRGWPLSYQLTYISCSKREIGQDHHQKAHVGELRFNMWAKYQHDHNHKTAELIKQQ